MSWGVLGVGGGGVGGGGGGVGGGQRVCGGGALRQELVEVAARHALLSSTGFRSGLDKYYLLGIRKQ